MILASGWVPVLRVVSEPGITTIKDKKAVKENDSS
jgi:hypothetical protein